jgi:hypothetical protein
MFFRYTVVLTTSDVKTVGLEDGGEIVEDPGCLFANIAGHQIASGGIDRDLPRGKDEVSGADGLRIRADGSGGVGGCKLLFGGKHRRGYLCVRFTAVDGFL